jgi:hypothetical protein
MKVSGPGIGSEFGLSKAGGYQFSSSHRVCLPAPGRASYVANGRAAIGLAVRQLRQAAEDGRDRVLLPAYLCHSMIQPFLEHGLRIDFYPVCSDLSIRTVEIAERIDDATLAVMLMHYFGFGQAENLASSIADEYPHVGIHPSASTALENGGPFQTLVWCFGSIPRLCLRARLVSW